MRGIEFAEVRDALVRAFNPDEFDMFLFEGLDFERRLHVAEGPFKLVVTNVLKAAEQEGWEALLIAEVAAARPLKPDIQGIYQKYAHAMIDEARRQVVDDARLKAMQRFGLGPRVVLQKSGTTLLPDATPSTDSGLERRVKQDLDYLNAGLWREQMFRQEGRVCRVEIAGIPVGTGFLVGPDALLTNHHVLGGVIQDRALASKVVLRFDYRVLGGGIRSDGTLIALHATDWLIDHSPCTAGERADDPDATLPTSDELDYALVRVNRGFGNEPSNPRAADSPQRGWVGVPAAAPAISPRMPLLILQHPRTEPLKLAFDTDAVLSVNANGTRLRYATNTEGGSSGSPCFDVQWGLVALHHYGDPLHDQARYNQGIPIGAIRDRLARVGLDAVLGGPPPG